MTTKEAVRRAAQRASERGLAISWDREHPDNPTDGPLYVAEWVIEYAKRNNHDGRQLPRVGVMWAELPAPVGFAPENPIALPGAAPGEAATRTASSEQQLIMAQAGERAQEIARLEAERDAARQLAELTGIENERLRAPPGHCRVPFGKVSR